MLTAVFVDQIAAQIPGALARLCNVERGFGIDGRVIEALGLWERAVDPATALAALEALERALLELGRRTAGQTVEPAHVELQEHRRSFATRRDFIEACSALDERERAAKLAEHAASYQPRAPPTLSARVTSWLGGLRD